MAKVEDQGVRAILALALFRNSLDTQLSLLYIQLTPKRVLIKDARTGVVGPAFLSWEKNEPNYSILGNDPQAVPAMENRSKIPWM